MSHAARSARPMSRWISTVRPLCLPLAASRPTRSGDEPGSIEYSAVTQPLPLPRIHRGTSSSIDAVHSTRVRPKLTRHEPAAISVKSRSNVTGRNSSTVCCSVRPVACRYCSKDMPLGSEPAVWFRMLLTRRSIITAGTSTVASATTASMTRRRNISSTWAFAVASAFSDRSAFSSSIVSNSLTSTARSSSSSGSTRSWTCLTLTV